MCSSSIEKNTSHLLQVNDETRSYIKAHRYDDVRFLALHPDKSGNVDMPFALQQIAGWQITRNKIPSWTNFFDIIYPEKIALEQCSNEVTARYKASIAKRLCQKIGDNSRLLDITGGFGVDFFFMSQEFKKAIYVEKQKALCDIVEHNFRCLDIKNATIICGDGTSFMQNIDKIPFVYADPSRRNVLGKRVYAIEDYTPNILSFANTILTNKANWLLIKLSPMLDWHKIVADFKETISEIHIVQADGECKELLIVASKREINEPHLIICLDDKRTLSITLNDAKISAPIVSPFEIYSATNNIFVYDPCPAVMKASCFGYIAKHYGLRQIAHDSHLFVSNDMKKDFPGRIFHLQKVFGMRKNELRSALKNITQANISVRHFPLSVTDLRRYLRINEGSDNQIFATTLADGRHVLLLCNRELALESLY